ncbi:MAG: glutamate synthase [Oscillospiraceae bacterium]|nr:glutamate synthase [Oscillospiraceae bacterium]
MKIGKNNMKNKEVTAKRLIMRASCPQVLEKGGQDADNSGKSGSFAITSKVINGCFGERFIGCGAKNMRITVNGTPGNALGSYLDGGEIIVHGNVQDAVGDTMNGGKIVVHGNAGDALGYAMRDGSIFVKGNAGYRAGIHMKEYEDKKPVIVIGGETGSFLGEYLAGGLIIVLGIGITDAPIWNFTGTGMHGGKIFIRTNSELPPLPKQVVKEIAAKDDLSEIIPYLDEFSEHFGFSTNELLNENFYILRPNAKNPYKMLYTAY